MGLTPLMLTLTAKFMSDKKVSAGRDHIDRITLLVSRTALIDIC